MDKYKQKTKNEQHNPRKRRRKELMCSTKGLSIPAPIHRHSSTHSQDKVNRIRRLRLFYDEGNRSEVI